MVCFRFLTSENLTSEKHGTLSCHQPWIGADFSTTIVWRFDAPGSCEAKSAYYRRCVLTSLSLHQGSPLTGKVLEPLNLVHVVTVTCVEVSGDVSTSHFSVSGLTLSFQRLLQRHYSHASVVFRTRQRRARTQEGPLKNGANLAVDNLNAADIEDAVDIDVSVDQTYRDFCESHE